MNINNDNYEIYILDYHEGTLNQSEKEALLAFLEENPAAKTAFNQFKIITLKEDEAVKYDFKESLKKPALSASIPVNLSNYNEFFIADLEGDLNSSQKKQLQSFLMQHPHLENDYRLFQISKFSADSTIVFENKKKLKKIPAFYGSTRKLFYQTISVAASLLIMAGVANYYYTNNKALPTKTTAEIINKNTNEKATLKPTKKIQNIIETTPVFALTPQSTTHKKLNFKNNTIQEKASSELKTDDIRLLASISNQITNLGQHGLIEETKRNYYTAINDLLALTENQSDSSIADQFIEPKKTSFLEKTADILKEQPLAEAGGFLKNAAVLGYTRIEELGANAKDAYLSIEEKLSRK